MYAVSVVYLSYETRKDHRSEAFKDLLLPKVAFGIPMPLIFNYILVVAIKFCPISTITCYYLQNTYQKHLSMSQVAVIFSFEPVLQQSLEN